MRKFELDEATSQLAEKEEKIDLQSRLIIDLNELVTSKTKELEDIVRTVIKKPPYQKVMKCVNDAVRKDKILWRSLAALLTFQDFKDPKKVNQGGFGGVLRAWCKRQKEQVAIKVCIADDKHSATHNHEINILGCLKAFHNRPPYIQPEGLKYVMKLHRTIDLNVMGSAFSMPLYQTDL